MKVMVIDDEAVMRTLFRKLLESKDCEILEAQNGSEGLRVVSSDVDVIFLDWLMPNMSGLEFLEQFRMDKKMDHVKVIMLTALSEIDNVVDAMDLGADDYIIKPFSPQVILEKLEAFTKA